MNLSPSENSPVDFPVSREEIEHRLQAIDPIAYGNTRNFTSGAVSRFSPYVSRGVLTLPDIVQRLESRGHTRAQMGKLVQQLAWREYFQRVWEALGDKIFYPIRQPQTAVSRNGLPSSIKNAATGIRAIDNAVISLYETGYLHNHLRLYIAGITCNTGKYGWESPAAWMYYHLLDGDLASNTCSWQWVAGCFSSKKYIANQENINRFTGEEQTRTFLDHSYEELSALDIPDILKEHQVPELKTVPPEIPSFEINPDLPFFLYNSYQLSPDWRKEAPGNRILLLEPSHFRHFPVSPKVMKFIIRLGEAMVPDLKICYMDFNEFSAWVEKHYFIQHPRFFSIRHPLTKHIPGHKDPYPWLFPEIAGFHPSFSVFWKKCAALYR